MCGETRGQKPLLTDRGWRQRQDPVQTPSAPCPCLGPLGVDPQSECLNACAPLSDRSEWSHRLLGLLSSGLISFCKISKHRVPVHGGHSSALAYGCLLRLGPHSNSQREKGSAGKRARPGLGERM